MSCAVWEVQVRLTDGSTRWVSVEAEGLTEQEARDQAAAHFRDRGLGPGEVISAEHVRLAALTTESTAIGQARDRCLAAVDRFVRDAGFTAPELMPMRYDQLRGSIEAAFEPDMEVGS